MPQERLWELLAKKLAGEATLTELDELQALLRQQPDMHYPLQTITDLWHHQPEHKEDAVAAFERHLGRMAALHIDFEPPAPEWEQAGSDWVETATVPRNGRGKWLVLSTLLLFVAALGLWFLVKRPGTTTDGLPRQLATNETQADSEVSTRNGSRSKTVLPDGTQVWLNAGSRLVYNKDFGKSKREATLTGEAYFDVIKDPSKPFIIHTNNIDIRVLGTAFNVRSYPGDKTTEASLIRGSIEVSIHDRPEEKILLKPNEKLIVSNDLEPARVTNTAIRSPRDASPLLVIDRLNYWPSDSTILETSWLENKLIFRDESFAELAERMERWFGVEIRFRDESLKQQRLTGIFESETLQQALKALQITSPFEYRIEGKFVLLYK